MCTGPDQIQYGARSSESKPRVRRPAKRLPRGRGDVREQLLGVGGGLGGGVGVREPPARVQQLAQHGRHVLDAIARLPIGNKGKGVGPSGSALTTPGQAAEPTGPRSGARTPVVRYLFISPTPGAAAGAEAPLALSEGEHVATFEPAALRHAATARRRRRAAAAESAAAGPRAASASVRAARPDRLR